MPIEWHVPVRVFPIRLGTLLERVLLLKNTQISSKNYDKKKECLTEVSYFRRAVSLALRNLFPNIRCPWPFRKINSECATDRRICINNMLLFSKTLKFNRVNDLLSSVRTTIKYYVNFVLDARIQQVGVRIQQ